MNLSRKKDVDVKYAGKWVFYFVLIGVMSGLGAILFHYLCGLGMHYFMDMMAGYRPEGSAGEHLLLPPHRDTVQQVGAVIFTCVGRHYPGTDSNYQNHCLHHHTDHGRLRGQGRPNCPDRGGFGSFLATRFNLSERERCIMMAAGIVAGLGSIFRAPLAGALFAAEVLYRDPDFESPAFKF